MPYNNSRTSKDRVMNFTVVLLNKTGAIGTLVWREFYYIKPLETYRLYPYNQKALSSGIFL
jgi:hypothetical protein